MDTRPNAETGPEATAPPLQRVARLLGHRWAPWVAIAAGVILTLPSIDNQLVLDDHVLMLQQRDPPGVPGLAYRPLDLFTFTNGARQTNQTMMDHGILLPWWTNPRLRNAFLRPISSATHLIDGWLWPRSGVMMHLHSLLWFGLLLFVVWTLYRRWLTPWWVAVLALLMYALDDAHGATISWIANRNALVSLAIGLPALHLHAKHRETGSLAPLLGGAAVFALGLLGGESGFVVLGYLLAYALWLDPRRLDRRALSLMPYGLVIVGWAATFHALGLGSYGSGAYHDPVREPVAFALALSRNLPILLGAQLGLPVADFAFFGKPSILPILEAISLATLAGLLYLSIGLLRRNATARFWATGMLLSAVPMAASVPGERLLIGVGIGGFGFVALLMVDLAERAQAGLKGRGIATAGLVALIGVHLIMGPIGLPIRSHSFSMLASAIAHGDDSLPHGPSVRGRSIIIVQTPDDLFANYIQVRRADLGIPRPERLTWLCTAGSPAVIERTAPDTLRIVPRDGFLYSRLDRHYRSLSDPFHPGERVHMPDFDAVVRRVTPDGRPAAVDFVFHAPLEHTGLIWRIWHDDRYVPFQFPPVGGSIHLPARDIYQVLLRHSFGIRPPKEG